MPRTPSTQRAGFEEQAAFFKALSHSARLKIVMALLQGEACVCHLEAMLNLRQAYLSQQLAVLKRAGLLNERREGPYVYYSLADERLPAVLEAGGTGSELSAAIPLHPTIAGCPCPHCEGGT